MSVSFLTFFYYCSWNRLSQNDQNEAYLPIAPNFVAEICSNRVTVEAVHQKMCLYMGAGVEVSINDDCYSLIIIVIC